MRRLYALPLVVRRWRQFLANRGLWRTIVAVGDILRRLPDAERQHATAGELWRNADQTVTAIHPFDLAHGTDTSGLIWGEHLRSGHRHDAWSTAYYGIAPSIFQQALECLQISINADWSRYTFVDVGSGKGRAVLLAAATPFARVIGVELAPELHAVAIENVRVVCRNIPDAAVSLHSRLMMLQADAADFPWGEDPGGPLLFFLYNPFSRPVLLKFLKRLKAELETAPREMCFLLVNPELDAAMKTQPWMEKLWEETFPIGDADQLDDRFGSTTETVAAYRVKRL